MKIVFQNFTTATFPLFNFRKKIQNYNNKYINLEFKFNSITVVFYKYKLNLTKL